MCQSIEPNRLLIFDDFRSNIFLSLLYPKLDHINRWGKKFFFFFWQKWLKFADGQTRLNEYNQWLTTMFLFWLAKCYWTFFFHFFSFVSEFFFFFLNNFGAYNNRRASQQFFTWRLCILFFQYFCCLCLRTARDLLYVCECPVNACRDSFNFQEKQQQQKNNKKPINVHICDANIARS